MDNYSNNVIRIIIQNFIRIIIRSVIRITFFFGQNRLISEHNIDKNYIFIQRNKSCQEDMLHFISKLSFSIRIGTSELFSTARVLHPAEDCVRCIFICGEHT